MEQIGINIEFLIIQAVFLLLIVGWIVLLIVSLNKLKQHAISHTARALWTMVIIMFPILGALVYLFVGIEPGNAATVER